MLSIGMAVGVGFIAVPIAAGVGIPAAGAVGIKGKSPAKPRVAKVAALPLYQNLLANAAGATIESYFVRRLRGDARDHHLLFPLWAQELYKTPMKIGLPT